MGAGLMSFKLFKAALVAGVALIGTTFGASAALISQGVTFTFEAVDANTLRFTVDNLPNATGNWASVNFFDAFDLRNVGSFLSATATYGATSQSAVLGKQVSGSGVGCNNGGGASACFNWVPNLSITDHMVFNIAFVPNGAGLNFSDPHLKVSFLVNDDDTKKTGDLLSQDIPITTARSVPGPIVGAGIPGLVMALGGLLAWRRRKVATAIAA
jgi:hypothetical protein